MNRLTMTGSVPTTNMARHEKAGTTSAPIAAATGRPMSQAEVAMVTIGPRWREGANSAM